MIRKPKTSAAVAGAVAAVLALSLPSGDGAAQAQSVRVAMGGETQLVNLPRGRSAAIDLPSDARDVIVSNPTVAEAVLHSPRRITVIGLAPGETDAVFLDASGRAILSLRVRVDAGVGALQDTLSRILPGADVRAEAVNDSIILTGLVADAAQADRAAQVARAFVSAPEKVMNMISIGGSDQVTLKVRVVEVRREVIKQLGLTADVVYSDGINHYGMGRSNSFPVNGGFLGGEGLCYGRTGSRTTNYSNTNTINSVNGNTSNLTNTIGSQTTNAQNLGVNFSGSIPDTITLMDANGNPVVVAGQSVISALGGGLNGSGFSRNVTNTIGSDLSNTVTSGVTNTVENIASSAYDMVNGTNVDACFQAFERVGLIRTLAEPNLTSVNGEDATFLAGGEFPVVVGRDDDGTILTEYKPYGVNLSFRPVVMSGGRISLQMAMEVSELTNDGALTLGAGTISSLTLPGITVRRVQNTVELPSGGSMMIAGLLQEDTRQAVDSLPGLGAVPVLGSMFRSRDYLMGETELVVLVEPYIVSPTSPQRMQTPADGLRIANDAQAIFFGQLNQAYGAPAAGTASAGWHGPVGYVIE